MAVNGNACVHRIVIFFEHNWKELAEWEHRCLVDDLEKSFYPELIKEMDK